MSWQCVSLISNVLCAVYTRVCWQLSTAVASESVTFACIRLTIPRHTRQIYAVMVLL